MSIEMLIRILRKILMDSEKRYSSMWYLKTESKQGHSGFFGKEENFCQIILKSFLFVV
jgi:hypothetical protein